MDPIKEKFVRILDFFKRYLFMCMFFEIAQPDIVFLADVDDSVSRQSPLLMRVRIEVELGYGSDRNERPGIVFEQGIEHIERKRAYPEIGESTRSVEQKNSLHGMALGIFQKHGS